MSYGLFQMVKHYKCGWESKEDKTREVKEGAKGKIINREL